MHPPSFRFGNGGRAVTAAPTAPAPVTAINEARDVVVGEDISQTAHATPTLT